MTLSSRLIATLTAAALTLTAFAAPAAAERDRRADTLAAILGLAVVGAIIHDQTKDRKKSQSTHTRQVEPKRLPRHVQPQRVNRKLLPQACFRSVNTHRGQVRMFGQRCLERNYRFTNHLPSQCYTRVRSFDSTRAGWGARCLRDHGYRLARG